MIKRFISYWYGNAKDAFDMKENGVLLTGVFLYIVSAVCKFEKWDNPLGETITKVTEVGGIVLACVWGFLWLPFRRHILLQKEKERREAELQAQIQNVNNQKTIAIDERIRSHDIEVFKRLEQTINETALRNCLNHLRAYNETEPSKIELLLSVVTRGGETQNVFMSPSLLEKRKQFSDALLNCILFVKHNFGNNHGGLSVGMDRLEYRLKPGYSDLPRSDPKYAEYYKASQELTRVCNQTLEAYDDYRREIKAVLFF